MSDFRHGLVKNWPNTFRLKYINQFIQFVDVKKLKNISGSLMQTFIYKQVYFLGENDA